MKINPKTRVLFMDMASTQQFNYRSPEIEMEGDLVARPQAGAKIPGRNKRHRRSLHKKPV